MSMFQYLQRIALCSALISPKPVLEPQELADDSTSMTAAVQEARTEILFGVFGGENSLFRLRESIRDDLANVSLAISIARHSIEDGLFEAESQADIILQAQEEVMLAVEQAQSNIFINRISSSYMPVLILLLDESSFDVHGNVHEGFSLSEVRGICTGTVTGSIVITANHCFTQLDLDNNFLEPSVFRGLIYDPSDINGSLIQVSQPLKFNAVQGVDLAWVTLPGESYTDNFGCFREAEQGEYVFGIGYRGILRSTVPDGYVGPWSDLINGFEVQGVSHLEFSLGDSGAGTIAATDACLVGVFTNGDSSRLGRAYFNQFPREFFDYVSE